MQLRAARRWLVATGTAAALVGFSAMPAVAEPTPTLNIFATDALIAAGSGGTEIVAIIFPSDPVVAHELVVKYDATAIASFATITTDDSDCTTAGAVVTCTYTTDEEIEEWGLLVVGAAIEPKATAANGDSGKVKITVSAEGLASASDEITVAIGEGVDLAAEAVDGLSAAPGGNLAMRPGIFNTGDTKAQGAALVVYDHTGSKAAKKYSNCTYVEDVLRMCTFEEDLAAGKSYGPTEALGFTLPSDLLAPATSGVELMWLTPAEWAAQKAFLEKLGAGDSIGTPGSGGVLHLAEKAPGTLPNNRPIQVDKDPSNNSVFAEIAITGSNKADVAAIGDSVTGAVGDVVEAAIGVVNHGPATAEFPDSAEPVVHTRLVVPAGTTVIEADEACAPFIAGEFMWEESGKPGAPQYLCPSAWALPKGEPQLYFFQLRIDQVIANVTGQVTLQSWNEQPNPLIDANRSNNTAKLVVNGDGGQGGGLPVTGVQVGMVSAIGAALALVGFLLFRMNRRRILTED